MCNDIIAADVNAAAKAGKENPANIVQAVPIVGLSVPCSLCRMPTDVAEGLMIPNRGILCVGCVVEIEAAVAERGEDCSGWLMISLTFWIESTCHMCSARAMLARIPLRIQ